MKRITLILAAFLLTGCAGLKTGWRMQLDMIYTTPVEVAPSDTVPPPLAPGKPA